MNSLVNVDQGSRLDVTKKGGIIQMRNQKTRRGECGSCAFAPLEPRIMFAAAPQLLVDVPGMVSSDSAIPAVVNVGGLRYFVNGEAGPHNTYGELLWRMDGTPAGTHAIDGTWDPFALVPFRGQLIFSRDTNVFRTDGSVSGTVGLVPTSEQYYLGNPAHLTAGTDVVYFVMPTGLASGIGKVYRTDGTAEGTRSVGGDYAVQMNRIYLEGPYVPLKRVILQGKLFFVGIGPKKVTHVLMAGSTGDVVPLHRVDATSELAVVGDRVMFRVDGALYQSDAAGAVSRVTDASGAASQPGGRLPFQFNGVRYFVSDSGTPNHQLWRTNGPTGKTLLAGSAEGFGGVRDAVALGNGVVFTGDDGSVWRSDGTPAGTRRIIGRDLTDDRFDPSPLVVAGDRAFFTAITQKHGHELWATDGSLKGTVVYDMAPGSSGSVYRGAGHLTSDGNSLYFTAATYELGHAIYQIGERPPNQPPTQPAPGGPYAVGEGGSLTLATSASDPEDDALSFLWDLDGDGRFDDAAGATVTLTWDQLRAAGITDGPAVFNVRVQASDGTNVMTSAQTTLTVSNAAPTITPSGAATALVGVGYMLQLKGWDHGDDPITRWMIDWGDGTVENRSRVTKTASHTYATTGSRTIRVWGTSDDGKFPGAEVFVDVIAFPAGHNLVKDVYPGPSGSDSRGVVAVGGMGFFVADHPEYGRELWRTDGTPAGTWMVKDIIPGANGSFPEELTPVGKHLYFRADNKLWKTDGTWRGTIALSDPDNPFGGWAGRIVRYGNGVLFLTALGGALMRSDGTAAGTTVVPTEGTTGTPNVNDAARVVGSRAYFVSDDPTDAGHYAIWAYDGQVARVVRGGFESQPKLLADDGEGIVYFRFGSSGLWRTDGSLDGTYRIDHPYEGGIYDADDFQIVNGRLYFNAILVDQFIGLQYVTRTGRELWSMDPAGRTATIVRDINPGGESGNPSTVSIFNGTAYFSAADPSGRGLWRTDGTEAGTQRATEAWAAMDTDDVEQFGNGLIFTARSAAGLGLYRTASPDAEPALVRLLAPPHSGNTPAPTAYGFIPHGDFVYFIGADGEIWQTDGTDAGTRPFTAIDPGPDRAFITQLRVVANHLFFNASTEPTGNEVWSIPLDNPVPPPIPGTLAGNVFADVAADGVRNAGDYMVGGFRVFLDRNGDGWWNRGEIFARTDDVGRYTITDVPAGLYWLRVTHIGGWRFTTNDALRVRVTPGGDVIRHFGVTRNVLVLGSVFLDANLSGGKDDGEAGLAGWTVFTDADNDGVLDPDEVRVRTDAAGRFAIRALAGGTHRIRIVEDASYRRTAPAAGFRDVSLLPGAIATRINFGMTPIGG